MEKEIIAASLSLFGTKDYKSILSILPAYDGAVREFQKKVKQIRRTYEKRKDI